MTSLNIKEPTPVKIGAQTLFCEKMNLSARTVIHQTPTVLGVPVKTNKCRHMTTLTLSGRVYDTEHPMRLALLINNMNSLENLDIIYKDMKFTGCTVTGIKAEDSCTDYIELSVTLTTPMLGILDADY